MLTLSGTAATTPRPELPAEPRERLLAVALHMHDTLARLPWVVEEIVGAEGGDCGLAPADAVRAYRTIWHRVYGDLAFRHAMRRRAEEPERKRYFPDMLTEADADELPHLAALAGRWEELTVNYATERQLGAVIDGLLSRAERPR
ncbi:hypothetical protein [Streptomyces formicae]|uniref:Transcriptional regulator, TetR family n=1 Tax=Streptomyces formicae TaxID=1616117 RepID=A0A291QE16_9ACTN|nr:hypothetical protein [Streptomyces formicae]ATL29862.1 Transcriptional regulator, TetR family [Streptomyces formicae]